MIPPYPVVAARGAWTATCPACSRYRTPKKGSPDKARRALHDHVTGVPACAETVRQKLAGGFGLQQQVKP